MSITIKSLTCPQCGATITYEPGKEKITSCAYCGTALDVSEEYQEKKDRERDDRQDVRLNTLEKKKIKRNTIFNESRSKHKSGKGLKYTLIIIGFLFLLGAIQELIDTFILGHIQDPPTKETVEIDWSTAREMNPFDYIEITEKGWDGDGTIDVYSTMRYTEVLNLKIDGLHSGMSNGEKFTITIPNDQMVIKITDEPVRFTQTTKEYTVSKLRTFITDVNELDDEDYNNLVSYGEKYVIDEVLKYNSYKIVEDSVKLYKIYSLVNNKEKSGYHVFIYTYNYINTAHPDDAAKSAYYMLYYDGIYKNAEGKYVISFDPKKWTYNTEGYIYPALQTMSAHTNFDDVYKDVCLNNKAKYNIYENEINLRK